MPDPLSNVLPTPKSPLRDVTVGIDEVNLEWLDGIASRTGRSRSDALREVLTGVREAQERGEIDRRARS